MATTNVLEALAAHVVDTLEVDAMGFQIDELSKEGNSAQVSKRLTALSTRRGTLSRSS